MHADVHDLVTDDELGDHWFFRILGKGGNRVDPLLNLPDEFERRRDRRGELGKHLAGVLVGKRDDVTYTGNAFDRPFYLHADGSFDIGWTCTRIRHGNHNIVERRVGEALAWNTQAYDDTCHQDTCGEQVPEDVIANARCQQPT